MWNPCHPNFFPSSAASDSPSNTQPPPTTHLPEPNISLSPSPSSSWLPFYTSPSMHSRQPYPTPSTPMHHHHHHHHHPPPPLPPLHQTTTSHSLFQQDPPFVFGLDNNNDGGGIVIKDERTEGSDPSSSDSSSALPPFLPVPRGAPAPYLPPFSAVPCASSTPTTAPLLQPPFFPSSQPQHSAPPPPPFHNSLMENSASSFQHPMPRPSPIHIEPETLNMHKRQREEPPHLPSLLSPFSPHTSSPYISVHPPPTIDRPSYHQQQQQQQQQQQHQYNSIPPLPTSEDDNNRNKRQRLSVVTTTSVRTNANRMPGSNQVATPGVDVATTTTTTTISTSTTTTTSRSISTTTTTTTRGVAPPIAPLIPPFAGSLFGPNPTSFVNNIVNRLRQDPRHFPMMQNNHHHNHNNHPSQQQQQQQPQNVDVGSEGWTDRPHDDDIRVAFDELRDFFSRSSPLLSPFLHFRMRTGHGLQDEDDDDDDEEEEEVLPFDQMNIPQIEFEEGVSQINEKLCVICQDEYKNGEKLSTLPCVHHFHTDCIKKWIDECKAECPLCKAELA